MPVNDKPNLPRPFQNCLQHPLGVSAPPPPNAGRSWIPPSAQNEPRGSASPTAATAKSAPKSPTAHRCCHFCSAKPQQLPSQHVKLKMWAQLTVTLRAADHCEAISTLKTWAVGLRGRRAPSSHPRAPTPTTGCVHMLKLIWDSLHVTVFGFLSVWLTGASRHAHNHLLTVSYWSHVLVSIPSSALIFNCVPQVA